MTAEFPPIDRDKSPLLDADHDPVRIADALRRSPHFAAADAEPGGDTVRFTTEAYVTATWDKQDLPLREHAQAVARTLRTR